MGPEQPPARVPGYSCANCGVLVAPKRSLLLGIHHIHCWSGSIFCFPRKLDFWHRAMPSRP